MLALIEGDEDLVLGTTEINASRFYGRPETCIQLPIRGDFFKLDVKCSIQDGENCSDDVNISKIRLAR